MKISHKTRRSVLGWIAILWDGLMVILALFILFVLVTEGGEYRIASGLRISAYHIINPLAALFSLFLLRLSCLRKISLFNIPSLTLDRMADGVCAGWETLSRNISGLNPPAIKRIIFWTIVVSILAKMAIAYFYFGFFSGDDVEVQEMSFAHLFHWNWKAWELRNPVFPMVFIYPVQFVLKVFGVEKAWPLIFAGRLVVIAFSSLNLWLVYRIASRLYDNRAVGLISLFFLALSKLHTTFAGSELPRTVSSTFVLLGFWFLLSKTKHAWATILSGCALGLAASLRFSEILYIGPAFLFLFLRKERARAFRLAVVSVASFVLIIGLSDALYWKSPFFSLINIVDYILVKQLSSRGYEPIQYLFSNIGLWTNYFLFSLAVYALRLRNNNIYLWAFSPVVLFSLLPHKEPRYLVPALPFWTIMAGLSVWHLLSESRKTGLALKVSMPERRILSFLGGVVAVLLVLAHKDSRYSLLALLFLCLMAVVYCVGNWRAKREGQSRTTFLTYARSVFLIASIACLSVVIEISGFRFHRSESGVEMARYLTRRPDLKILAIEDHWRAGGRLYLGKGTVLINVDAAQIFNPPALRQMIFETKAQAVGIREESLHQSGCRTVLESLGFREIRFTGKKRKENYRLFLKNRESTRLF